MAAFETKAGKLVLTLHDAESDPDTVYHYGVYDNLMALGNDNVLVEQFREEDRVEFLDALAKRLGQEWAAVWID